MTLEQLYSWLNEVDRKFHQLQKTTEVLLRFKRQLLRALVFNVVFVCFVLPLLLPAQIHFFLSSLSSVSYFLLFLSLIGVWVSIKSLINLSKFKKVVINGMHLANDVKQILKDADSKDLTTAKTHDVRKRTKAATRQLEQFKDATVLSYYFGPLDPVRFFHRRFGLHKTTFALYLIENWLFLVLNLLNIFFQTRWLLL